VKTVVHKGGKLASMAKRAVNQATAMGGDIENPAHNAARAAQDVKVAGGKMIGQAQVGGVAGNMHVR
jgi:hypothetical protein